MPSGFLELHLDSTLDASLPPRRSPAIEVVMQLRPEKCAAGKATIAWDDGNITIVTSEGTVEYPIRYTERLIYNLREDFAYRIEFATLRIQLHRQEPSFFLTSHLLSTFVRNANVILDIVRRLRETEFPLPIEEVKIRPERERPRPWE